MFKRFRRELRLKENRLPTPVKSKITIILILIIPIIATALVTNFSSFPIMNSAETQQIGTENNTASEPEHIVPLDKIVSGGPPQDGIPSIDNPKFVSIGEADKFLRDVDQVVGLNIKGDIRAYPLQILVWHEIVNDKVGGFQLQ